VTRDALEAHMVTVPKSQFLGWLEMAAVKQEVYEETCRTKLREAYGKVKKLEKAKKRSDDGRADVFDSGEEAEAFFRAQEELRVAVNILLQVKGERGILAGLKAAVTAHKDEATVVPSALVYLVTVEPVKRYVEVTDADYGTVNGAGIGVVVELEEHPDAE